MGRSVGGIVDDIEAVVKLRGCRRPGPEVDRCLMDITRSRLLMERAGSNPTIQHYVIRALIARVADVRMSIELPPGAPWPTE